MHRTKTIVRCSHTGGQPKCGTKSVLPRAPGHRKIPCVVGPAVAFVFELGVAPLRHHDGSRRRSPRRRCAPPWRDPTSRAALLPTLEYRRLPRCEKRRHVKKDWVYFFALTHTVQRDENCKFQLNGIKRYRLRDTLYHILRAKCKSAERSYFIYRLGQNTMNICTTVQTNSQLNHI